MSEMEFNKNLTVGQSAMIAVGFLPEFKKQAKERQGTRTDLGPNIPQSIEKDSGDAMFLAGMKVGVSHESIRQAVLLEREHPDLAERVSSGEITLHRAFTEHKKRERLMETDINALFSESDVYFIYAESCNLVKIGWAVDAENRSHTNSPTQLS